MSKSLALLALASTALAGAKSLADIKHVVFLMKENRAFDHMFGTMAGVRGHSDPNVAINPETGLSTWYQPLTGLTTEASYQLPWYIGFQGLEDGHNMTQCSCAGANNWIQTSEIMNYGRSPYISKWAGIDTAQSQAYFKREDNPFYWALADAYALADNYHAGVLSNTDPNRAYWQSGAIGQNGSASYGLGGIYLDDVQSDGCATSAVEGEEYDCFPLKWTSYGQIMDEAGVDYFCYENSYNWPTTNDFQWFEQYINAPEDSSMYQRCMNFDGPNAIETFIARAGNGTLPEVSYLFSPGSMQEHPPYTVQDGEYFTRQIVEAIINGPAYNETLFFLTYDEGGGWADHVYPTFSPVGTAGEWIEDPTGSLDPSFVPIGPGVRIPLWIVSPYSAGGKVFTENCDHTSFIFFLEVYLTARGYENVTSSMPTEWRRQTMCNLVDAFDFENPDFTIPILPEVTKPLTNDDDEIVGLYSGYCSTQYGTDCSGSNYFPAFPWGNQTVNNTMEFEEGFKSMRGYMSEGRSIVIEANGYALANLNTSAKQFTATPATANHESIHQRWVVWQLDPSVPSSPLFNITSAVNNTKNGLYISQHSSLSNSVTGAEIYNITYVGADRYVFIKENGDYLGIKADGALSFTDQPTEFSIYAVSYHDSFPNGFPIPE